MPEKPQRNPIVTMAPKRVLDGSALSGHDGDDGGDDELEYTQDNERLQEEEPIDVFNPVGVFLGVCGEAFVLLSGGLERCTHISES